MVLAPTAVLVGLDRGDREVLVQQDDLLLAGIGAHDDGETAVVADEDLQHRGAGNRCECRLAGLGPVLAGGRRTGSAVAIGHFFLVHHGEVGIQPHHDPLVVRSGHHDQVLAVGGLVDVVGSTGNRSERGVDRLLRICARHQLTRTALVTVGAGCVRVRHYDATCDGCAERKGRDAGCGNAADLLHVRSFRSVFPPSAPHM